MSGTSGNTEDDALFAELGDVLRDQVGAPPPDLVSRSREVFTWRTIDAELAALTFDSLIDSATPVRSGEGPRMLVFESTSRRAEVEVLEDPGGRRRLLGQLLPPAVAMVQVHLGANVVHTAADELGRFVLELPPSSERAVLRWSAPDGSGAAVADVIL